MPGNNNLAQSREQSPKISPDRARRVVEALHRALRVDTYETHAPCYPLCGLYGPRRRRRAPSDGGPARARASCQHAVVRKVGRARVGVGLEIGPRDDKGVVLPPRRHGVLHVGPWRLVWLRARLEGAVAVKVGDAELQDQLRLGRHILDTGRAFLQHHVAAMPGGVPQLLHGWSDTPRAHPHRVGHLFGALKVVPEAGVAVARPLRHGPRVEGGDGGQRDALEDDARVDQLAGRLLAAGLRDDGDLQLSDRVLP
mmetsp:Transcript_22892/g.75950  ORF Transcript_22892/g.75950 Transcript_22892/m.75950 type:complete len:254 (+) Transcript_22892:12-773(+)